jgi:hypothetical protein
MLRHSSTVTLTVLDTLTLYLWQFDRLRVRPICHTDITNKGQRMNNTEKARYLELIAIAKSDVMLASEFDELLGLQKKLGK